MGSSKQSQNITNKAQSHAVSEETQPNSLKNDKPKFIRFVNSVTIDGKTSLSIHGHQIKEFYWIPGESCCRIISNLNNYIVVPIQNIQYIIE